MSSSEDEELDEQPTIRIWEGTSAHGRVLFNTDGDGNVIGQHALSDEKKRRKDHLWEPLTRRPETPKIEYGRPTHIYVESDGEDEDDDFGASGSSTRKSKSGRRRSSAKRQQPSPANEKPATPPPASPGKWWHVSDKRIEEVVGWLTDKQAAVASAKQSRKVPQFIPKEPSYGPPATGSLKEDSASGGLSLHDSSASTGEADEALAPLPKSSTLAWTTSLTHSDGSSPAGRHNSINRRSSSRAGTLRARQSVSISFATDYTAGPKKPRWRHSVTGDSNSSRPSSVGSIRMSTAGLVDRTDGGISAWGSVLNWQDKPAQGRPKLRGTTVNLGILDRTAAIPSVHRGTRHGAAPDELIDIYVNFSDVKGSITLSVHPLLHIGPDKPPTKEEEDEERAYLGRKKTRRWLPKWTISLKGLLKEATGIQEDHLFISFCGEKLLTDSNTLQDHSITHGCTLLGRERRPKDLDNLQLATTQRKKEVQEKRRKELTKASSRYLGFEASQQQGVEAKMRVMPNWVSQSSPELFAKVGEGLNQMGGQVPYVCFAETDIYRPFHDLQDKAMMRVRSSPAFTRRIYYEDVPV
eukprot:CAMPEP_0178420156 /NCGR_PEP_ID=MMETSP0689_2-20121128/25984_1 /TAXON_ID=160604 /ORGANISM="Amphidinium massartii, Strain CS-259" /LENGTH=579 /DNA_ID=CAMNT_0020041623 /DNA_START=55 /DNA_END=1794 /DNA_ORIENTATION=+